MRFVQILNYKDLDKTRVKLFPNFTRHHLITHTYFFSLFLFIIFFSFYLHCTIIICQLCIFFVNNRKQISPSRLTKSPKYENSNLNEVRKEPNSLEHQTASQEVYAHSPIPTHSEVSSPGNLTAFNGERFIDKEGLCNIVSSKISNNSVSNNSTVVSHGEEQESNDDFLVFTSGSEMIGFTRHPLED